MLVLLNVLVFALGAIVGSFLNVLVFRWQTGQSIIIGRSRCLTCGKTLAAGELIPIVSFFWQKARCRGCQAKLSWQYPLVELASGLLFVLVFWRFGFQPTTLVFYWLATALMLAIAVYDLRHKIIPDGFVYALIALALGRLLAVSSVWPLGDPVKLVPALLTGLGLFTFFAALWHLSRGQWMGFGDAKLALAIGWLLGWPDAVSATVLAFWLGAAVGLGLLALGRLAERRGGDSNRLFPSLEYLTIKSEIPFAPFLALGAWLSLFFQLNVFFV